jgi:hypothetical protein
MINYFFVIAGLLLLAAFIIHSIGGSKEYHIIKPNKGTNEFQYWTLGATCFQMVTVDLLLTGIFALLMGIEVIPYEYYLALFITLIYAGYLVMWLVTLAINRVEKSFYISLGQWTIFLSALILMSVGIFTQ